MPEKQFREITDLIKSGKKLNVLSSLLNLSFCEILRKKEENIQLLPVTHMILKTGEVIQNISRSSLLKDCLSVLNEILLLVLFSWSKSNDYIHN